MYSLTNQNLTGMSNNNFSSMASQGNGIGLVQQFYAILYPKQAAQYLNSLAPAYAADYNHAPEQSTLKTGNIARTHEIATSKDLDEEITYRLNQQTSSCCTISFSSFKELQEHIYQTHRIKNANKFSCNQCARTYRSAAMLAQHVSYHADQSIFKCPKCPVQAENAVGLKNHFNHHLNHPIEHGLQSECMREPNELITLRENGLEKKCCQEHFNTNTELLNHLISTHHPHNTSMTLRDQYDMLENHFYTMDPTIYACPKTNCGIAHKTRAALLAHYNDCVKKTLRVVLPDSKKRKRDETVEKPQKKQRLDNALLTGFSSDDLQSSPEREIVLPKFTNVPPASAVRPLPYRPYNPAVLFDYQHTL